MAEKLRVHFGDYLGQAEVVIYSVLAVLLFVTALATIADAGKMLWQGLVHWKVAAETLLVLDQLLVVLMLVHFHPLALSGNGTVPRRRADRFDSARPCNYLGSRQPHQGRNVVRRRSKHISSQHDRARFARAADSHPRVFHYTFAPVRPSS
jgi:hypothetical protein